MGSASQCADFARGHGLVAACHAAELLELGDLGLGVQPLDPKKVAWVVGELQLSDCGGTRCRFGLFDGCGVLRHPVAGCDYSTVVGKC